MIRSPQQMLQIHIALNVDVSKEGAKALFEDVLLVLRRILRDVEYLVLAFLTVSLLLSRQRVHLGSYFAGRNLLVEAQLLLLLLELISFEDLTQLVNLLIRLLNLLPQHHLEVFLG